MESRSLSRSSSKSDLGLPRSDSMEQKAVLAKQRWQLLSTQTRMPRPNRRGLVMERPSPKAPRALTYEDCGGTQWQSVQSCLGLQVGDDNTTLVATSRLGEEAIGPLVQRIGELVKEGRLKAVCRLMGMCKFSVLPLLLDKCSPEDVNELTTSEDAQVVLARDEVLTDAVIAMKKRQNDQFYKLVPLCSPVMRGFCASLLPPLTFETLLSLDNDVLRDALHLEVLERPGDQAARLSLLLDIAGRIEREFPERAERAVAIKCILWSALSDAQPDLLRTAELPQLTLDLLQKVPASLQGDVLRVAVRQAENAGKESGVRSLLNLALVSGNLLTAATLMHFSPDPEFPEELFKTILQRLAAGGFEVGQKPFSFGIKSVELADPTAKVAKKRQTLLAHQMVIALLQFNKLKYANIARTIISKIDAEPEQERAFILQLCKGLGSQVGSQRQTVVDALPALCTRYLFELEIILEMGEGKKMIAQAVKDYLLSDPRENIMIRLFEELAYRVPLLDVLPKIETTLEWTSQHERIKGAAPGRPLADMVAIAKSLKTLKLPIGRLAGFVDGWRSLGLIVLDQNNGRPHLVEDASRLLASKLVELAISTRSGEVLKLLEGSNFNPQEVVADMVDAGLLVGDALSDYVLATMSKTGVALAHDCTHGHDVAARAAGDIYGNGACARLPA